MITSKRANEAAPAAHSITLQDSNIYTQRRRSSTGAVGVPINLLRFLSSSHFFWSKKPVG